MSLTRWPQTRQLLGAVVILALLPAGSVIAQEMVSPEPLIQEHTLEDGTWRGTMTRPRTGTLEINYVVKTVDGELTISVEGTTFPPATDTQVWVAQEGSEEPSGTVILQFSFRLPTLTVDCKLRLQEDGSYEGECKDSLGFTGYLTMVPPQGG